MRVPFLLAPMAELSHRALRELIEGFGPADEYFTEMISAGAFVNQGRFEAWYADNGPVPEKLVYQITGSDEDQLEKTLILLDQKECLGIDMNMGCSAHAITRTGAGIRWMTDIDRAAALIRRLRSKTRRRLSVKLRTGLEDNLEYLVKFCRRLQDEGLDLITLHPRTARERFKRKAQWNHVFALRKELRIPVAGNGDIASADEMLRRAEECDAVMIGRLAVRQPWVFAEAKKSARTGEGVDEAMLNGDGPRILLPFNDAFGPYEHQEQEKVTVTFFEETGLRFLELLARYQPPEFHISRARRFFGYFCDNLKWGTHVRNLINREADIQGIERVWKGYFKTTNRTDMGEGA